jgi:hypothetical protein
VCKIRPCEEERPRPRVEVFGLVAFACEGGSHEIWTNGEETEPVPRHREISELLAKKIIRKAKAYTGPRK